MSSLFPERIDIEDREPSVPIMGALHLKKQYLNKMQGWNLMPATNKEKKSQISVQKHLLEVKAIKN